MAIFIDVEDPIRLQALFLDESDNSQVVQDIGHSIKYLLPLKLRCALPLSYPSEVAPQLSLSAEWLSVAQLSSLCQKLDEIWSEQVGMAVIYSWVDWLKTECLEYLSISGSLTLQNYIPSESDDRHCSKIAA